jgi:hypothetical protein
MRRRRLLGSASAAVGLAAGLAGCAELLGDVDPRRGRTRTTGEASGAGEGGSDASASPRSVSFPYEAPKASGNVADPQRVVVDHRGAEATFATVAVGQVGEGKDDGDGDGDGERGESATSDGEAPRERTLAVVNRSFEPGLTTLRVAIARRGRYRVVAETAAGDRAVGAWHVRDGLGDLTVTLDDLAGVWLRQSVPATPEARGIESTGTVAPASWPVPRAFAAQYGLRVANATAEPRRVAVDVEHDALSLSYEYRLPTGVRLQFPPLSRNVPLRVRVASRGATFERRLNGEGVVLPVAVRPDGVGFDPGVARVDARVHVGEDGPWRVRLWVHDLDGRTVDERFVESPSWSTRDLRALVDEPGVYRIRIRAVDGTGDPAGDRVVPVVARGRRVVRVDVGSGIRVRVNR